MANLIGFGMSNGELLTQYHPAIPRRIRKRIKREIRTKDPVQFVSGSDSFGYITGLKNSGEPEVEIFGVWEDGCVASAIVHSLREGLKVKVPKGLTYKDKSSQYDALVNKNNPAINEVVACLLQGKSQFDYYNNRSYHIFIPLSG